MIRVKNLPEEGLDSLNLQIGFCRRKLIHTARRRLHVDAVVFRVEYRHAALGAALLGLRIFGAVGGGGREHPLHLPPGVQLPLIFNRAQSGDE